MAKKKHIDNGNLEMNTCNMKYETRGHRINRQFIYFMISEHFSMEKYAKTNGSRFTWVKDLWKS